MDCFKVVTRINEVNAGKMARGIANKSFYSRVKMRSTSLSASGFVLNAT